MNSRLIWKDITRNKVVTLSTFLFVSVAAMLIELSPSDSTANNVAGKTERILCEMRRLEI